MYFLCFKIPSKWIFIYYYVFAKQNQTDIKMTSGDLLKILRIVIKVPDSTSYYVGLVMTVKKKLRVTC